MESDILEKKIKRRIYPCLAHSLQSPLRTPPFAIVSVEREQHRILLLASRHSQLLTMVSLLHYIVRKKQMAILVKIKKRIQREMFLPTWLGMLINPFYIIRNGLYKEVKQLSPLLKGHILDFGCGSKPYETLFFNAKRYIGVDIETSGHDHAASKIDFFYDGKTLPFESNRFDGLVSFETLEHVFGLDEIFAELNRVIKPGGKLMLSVPFVWDEHEIPYDFARYTSFGMRHLLSKHGFEVIEYKKTTTYFLTVCQMFIAYLYQHVLPENKWWKRLFQICLVFPLTLISLGLDLFFPKRFDFFCNSVIVAHKTQSSESGLYR